MMETSRRLLEDMDTILAAASSRARSLRGLVRTAGGPEVPAVNAPLARAEGWR